MDIPLPPPECRVRFKTPTIIQMEATECGAVAIAIILAYYGKFVPIEKLRIDCGVSRDGSNAYHMIEGIKKFGMEADGFTLELEELYHQPLPSILYWKFNHFVVLEGFGKNEVYINDPATGPRTISYDDLNQSFTGIMLSVKPTKAFQKGGKPLPLYHFWAKHLHFIKMPLLYTSLAGLCILLPSLAFPAFSQIFVDHVLINNDLSWKNDIIVGMGIAGIAIAILSFLQGTVLNRLQSSLSLQLSSQTFWHMLRLPLLFYTQRYPGEIAYRMGLNESISRTFSSNLAPTVINTLLAFIYGLAMFYYDPFIAGLTVLLVTGNLYLMSLVYRKRTDSYTRYQSELGRSQGYSLGGLQEIETIKATGLETRYFSRWAGYFTKVNNELQEVGKRDIYLSMMTPITNGLALIILLGFGVWRIMNGQLSIGMFIALQILQRNFMGPVLQLIGFSQSLQLARVDAARVKDIVEYPEDHSYAQVRLPEEKIGGKLSGKIDLKNISFGYNPVSPAIINQFSMQLRPGKCIGLTGTTGSGKSTIAKLIAGLLIPWEGEILYDEFPIDQISKPLFISSLALVEQEPFLFSGTVKENLTLLDSQISEETVMQAAIDACIHDDIIARMGGYDMLITENGANFSGGQKQRLELARALVKNPTIVIMDEALSAVDALTESKIIKNIKRRGCCILIISHRSSTMKNYDAFFHLS